jgi:hypothetical protein
VDVTSEAVQHAGRICFELCGALGTTHHIERGGLRIENTATIAAYSDSDNTTGLYVLKYKSSV